MRHPFARLLATSIGLLALACDPSSTDPGGHATEVSPGAAEPISAVLAGDDALVRARDFADLLTGLEAEAVPAVRGALEAASLDTSEAEIPLQLFATWWAGLDPEAALAWANRDWRAPAGATTTVLRTWAASDPRQAWEGISGIRPDSKNAAKAAVISAWYRSDPDDLVAFVRKLPQGEPQQRAMETLALEKTRHLGAEAALRWADGLADPAFHDLMRKRVAGAAGLLDPEAAAAWAKPQIDDGFRTNGLARRVATRWVLSDPEAAMAWLSTLPAGGTRYDGVLEAYRDWLRLSPLEAVKWIRGREYEPWLEPALALYARAALGRGDPAGAFALVAQFGDERLRSSTQVYIARKWLLRDREAADAWIQQSELPKGVKERAFMIPDAATLEERAARRRAQENYELSEYDSRS